MRLDSALKKSRPQYISAQKIVLKKWKKLCILIQIKSDLLELFYLAFYIVIFYEIWILEKITRFKNDNSSFRKSGISYVLSVKNSLKIPKR
jgi:hypothetical protein